MWKVVKVDKCRPTRTTYASRKRSGAYSSTCLVSRQGNLSAELMSLLNALLAVDMPGSSELSDALNPNFFSGKRKSRNTVNGESRGYRSVNLIVSLLQVGSDGERLTEERDPTQEEHFRNDDNGTVASSPEISPVLTARP